MTYYKQCALEKNTITFFLWLPEKYAEVGKKLQIRYKSDWKSGWVVLRVFTVRLDEKQVEEDESDIRILPEDIKEDEI